MTAFVGTARDEALLAAGRYGIVSQSGSGPHPPYFYGLVIEVHSTGDYLKFQRAAWMRSRWYHRRDVSLHPLDPAAP